MNKIENRITYFIISFGSFLMFFKKFSLLNLIIGSILALLFILLFEKTNFKKKNITKFFLLFFSFVFMIFSLNKISYFIGDNILREYSILFISFSLLFTIFILAKKGYHTIIKVILLASYFLFLFSILGFLITIPYINIQNLNIKFIKTTSLLKESLLYCFLLVYTYFLIYPITNTKFNKKDLTVNTIYQIFIYLLTISILGTTLTNLYKYPFITIFKKVNLIGFIERVEILFSMNYLFFLYFLMLFSFYQIKFILEEKIKKEKTLTYILLFITFLIFFMSTIL